MPETYIFMIWTSRKSFIRLGHATDQKCHLGLIRLRIFKMRWVSVANDHLGPKPLISDSATERSLWLLECQPVALNDNEWQISKTLIPSSIQTHGQVSKKSYFDIWHFLKIVLLIKAHMRTWSSEPEPEPPEPVHFARSRSRKTVLLGVGAGLLPGSRSRPKMSRLRIPDVSPLPGRRLYTCIWRNLVCSDLQWSQTVPGQRRLWHHGLQCPPEPRWLVGCALRLWNIRRDGSTETTGMLRQVLIYSHLPGKGLRWDCPFKAKLHYAWFSRIVSECP